VVKVGTSNSDRTVSLKMLQCVVENKKIDHRWQYITAQERCNFSAGKLKKNIDTDS